MRQQYAFTLVLLIVAMAFSSAPVFAKDDCQVAIERWQSRDAVLQAAAQRGWRVERLKIDDGCYEVRGTDAEGQPFKAKLDPQTLQTIKFKQRQPERKRNH